MSTSWGRETATLTTLTAGVSVAADPPEILQIAEKHLALESIYFYGLSLSDWMRIASALALLAYFADKMIKPIFRFIINIFRK